MDEIIKAGVTAISTALVTQVVSITGVLEMLTDPYSPKKVLEEAQETLKLLNSWAEASAHLQSIPVGPLRDDAQKKIDQIYQSVSENLVRCARMGVKRRDRLFRLLSFLRIAGTEGWIGRGAAFLFYVFTILAIQSMRMSAWEKNAWFTPILLLGAGTFWLLSWPKKKALESPGAISLRESE